MKEQNRIPRWRPGADFLCLAMWALALAPGPQFGSCFGAAVISLNNYDANRPIYYQTVGDPAAGPNFYVQILGGPDANSLQPIHNTDAGSPSIFSIGSNNPGLFDAGLGIVPEANSYELAVFQVRAWTGASTFEAASQRVASALIAQQTGDSTPPGPPAPLPFLSFPANLVIPGVPEPANRMLFLLGFLALFSHNWNHHRGERGG